MAHSTGPKHQLTQARIWPGRELGRGQFSCLSVTAQSPGTERERETEAKHEFA